MDTVRVDAVLNQPKSHQESCALTDLYVRSQSVVSRRISGETLIVPVCGKVGDLASIYSFNGSGTLLWESLASPQSFADLVDAIEREYAVEREPAERDVRQFLNDAINAGLIEIREPEFLSNRSVSDGFAPGEFVSDGVVSGHAFSRAEDCELKTHL